MKVFLTGGTGLVGSHAIERLHGLGHAVVAMVRDARGDAMVETLGARAVRGSVENPASWRHADDADVILHAAAVITAAAEWDHYEAVNVGGTRLAVRAAARSGARLVHLSSVAVYGDRSAGSPAAPITENGPFGAIADGDHYARSKRMAEDALWTDANDSGVSAVAIRPPVLYGERDRQFMPRILAVLRFGIAPVVGSGDNTLAMVYVGNVIDVIVAALERPDASGAFNVANDGTITQQEFYDVVAAGLGRRLWRVHVSENLARGATHLAAALHDIVRPGRYGVVRVSSGGFLARDNPFRSDRAVQELGWRPSTAPRDAVRRTVGWFVEQAHPGR